MNKQLLMKRLEQAWKTFEQSYSELSEHELTKPGVTGEWTVKDIIAHVTWWEEEALKHLPTILTGGKSPRYSVLYGGIDAFNALMTDKKKSLPLSEVMRQQGDTHRRLIDFIRSAPEDHFSRETRFLRRLRLDTYSHYLKHARAIQKWREQQHSTR
jgi:hypothetical protein